MRPLRILVTVLLLLASAGCHLVRNEPEEPLDVVSMDEAVTRAHDRATAVADHLGVSLRNPRRGPVACSDPIGRASTTGVYYMSATQQLPVGEDRMTETMHTMQEYFTERGYDVSDIRWSPDGSGGGQLRATDPDGFGFSLGPTLARTGYAFSVTSPCYQAPEGEDPTDGRWHPPADMIWEGESPEPE